MQSLLFCRDENSAHALTPLVEGLDISVKRETEVYLAMRTLMAESFDFLIIDCEDEPTGRLILKNARGSAMNKGTLVVAIVNLETGANALRFGADFLITKPVIAEVHDFASSNNADFATPGEGTPGRMRLAPQRSAR